MTAITRGTEQSYERTSGPVHTWFGLSYANFAVQHRARLQSMPLDWQQRYVHLQEELDAAYASEANPEFEVNTVRWEQVGDLSEAELAGLGITRLGEDDEDDPDGDGDPDEWADRNGRTLQRYDSVAIAVPDPVPHYRHAYLPPDEEAIAALRLSRRSIEEHGA